MGATDRTYADGNAFCAEHRCNLGNRILRLGYSHTISDDLQSAVANLELWYVKNMLEPTRITLSALAKASTVSSTVVFVIVPSILCAGSDADGVLIPPNNTFVRERFIATH